MIEKNEQSLFEDDPIVSHADIDKAKADGRLIEVKTKVSAVWYEILLDATRSLGFRSLYDLTQVLLAYVAQMSRGWHPSTTEFECSLIDCLNGFVNTDQEELAKRALSMQVITGMKVPATVDKQRIDTLIAILRGGQAVVMESPGLWAEISLSLHEAFDRVVMDQSPELSAICDELRPYYGAENKTNLELITICMRETLDCVRRKSANGGEYAQTTYGIVPKRTRTIQPK